MGGEARDVKNSESKSSCLDPVGGKGSVRARRREKREGLSCGSGGKGREGLVKASIGVAGLLCELVRLTGEKKTPVEREGGTKGRRGLTARGAGTG